MLRKMATPKETMESFKFGCYRPVQMTMMVLGRKRFQYVVGTVVLVCLCLLLSCRAFVVWKGSVAGSRMPAFLMPPRKFAVAPIERYLEKTQVRPFVIQSRLSAKEADKGDDDDGDDLFAGTENEGKWSALSEL
jgi:hypothetical protein